MLKRFAAVLFLAASAVPAPAADLPAYPFIHASATADVRLMPDIGEIDIDIVSLEPDADSAWRLINERLDASRALFARHGVAPEDIYVQDIVRRPRKVEALPDGEPVPMETRVALHVTVRDLAQWTPLLRTLLGMQDLESLAVSFNRSDRDKVETDLVNQALAMARQRALTMARGVGARLGPANGVSMSPLKNLSNAMGLANDPNGRYTGGRRESAPPDRALVQAMRLSQSADVIYRIQR